MSTPLLHADLAALEKIIKKYIDDFSMVNHAAKVILRGLSLIGVGARPLVDHFVFRTLNPKERIEEFRSLGYTLDPSAKFFSEKKPHIEVYRCRCLPAILLEEAHGAVARDWVKTFGDAAPYIMAMRVDDLEDAELHLEKQGVGFLRPSAGKTGEELREIASFLTCREGKTVNALVLVERHAGNMNYYAPDFWAKA